MAMIPTKLHGVLDYAGGALLLAAPGPLAVSDRRARAVLRGVGGAMLAQSALTDYELGVKRVLPMRAHLLLDGATGVLLASAPWTLRKRGRARDWLPHVLVGAAAVGGALLTERSPGRTSPEGAQDGLPGVPRSPSNTTGPLARTAPGETGAQIAPAPLETPGPSVPPIGTPESETERAERADALRPDRESPQEHREEEILVAQEEAAAAAEAAAIGGQAPHDADDPAMDPVYQAGGGEEEGFEAAERDLEENATHGDGRGNPLRDALGGELESDRSTAVYGEADEVSATEVVEDPAEGPEDPGAGPGIAADR